MKSGIATLDTPPARGTGSTPESERAAAGDGDGTPFAEVMDAQDKPASAAGGTQPPTGIDGPGARPGAAADDTEAGDADSAVVLDEAGLAALLEMCAPSTSAEAPAAAELQATAQPAESPATAMQAAWPPLVPAAATVPAGAAGADGRPTPAEVLTAGIGPSGMPREARPVGLDELQRLALAGEEGGSVSGAGGPELPSGTALAEVRHTQRPATGESTTPASRPPELRAPIGTPAWTDELGSRVTWMVERGEQVASLRLSPENLGPLEVRIAVREGETTVWFGAAQADTRAALEQSLPRLKEMLGASGLALANAGVFSQTPRDPQRGFTAAALARASLESGAEPVTSTVTGFTGRGLVDLYA